MDCFQTIRVNTLPYFLSRRKKGGTYRTILNLKGSNRNVHYYHFKTDIIWTVLRLWLRLLHCICRPWRCLFTQFLLPKPLKNTSNLGRGMTYTDLCFPNGLSICHQIFNKLLKPVFVALRQQDQLSSLIKMTLFLQGQSMMSVRAQCHRHYYTVWLPWVCYTPS